MARTLLRRATRSRYILSSSSTGFHTPSTLSPRPLYLSRHQLRINARTRYPRTRREYRWASFHGQLTYFRLGGRTGSYHRDSALYNPFARHVVYYRTDPLPRREEDPVTRRRCFVGFTVGDSILERAIRFVVHSFSATDSL